MGTMRRQKAFSYVLVSAVPIEERNAAGIGVIFKDDNRRTVTKISQAFGEQTVEGATYEALTLVLEEAMRLGVRAFTIYLDSPAVVAQVTQTARVPGELLAGNLQVRALMNAVGRVQLRLAKAGRNFSARALASGATRTPRPSVQDYAPLQLTLLGDTAVA